MQIKTASPLRPSAGTKSIAVLNIQVNTATQDRYEFVKLQNLIEF